MRIVIALTLWRYVIPPVARPWELFLCRGTRLPALQLDLGTTTAPARRAYSNREYLQFQRAGWCQQPEIKVVKPGEK
jgi:hypothetical protein